jgi:DNA-binding NarL/FixJ family response regulator
VSRNIHIIIAEPSAIVFEGLVAIFLKSGLKHHVSKVDSLDEIQQLYLKRKCELILVNPALIQNNIKTYNLLKTQLPNTQWMALVFAYYSQYLLSQFDAVITISDTPEMIVSMISRAVNSNNPQEQTPLLDVLSDREVDVLKLLASGLANKEIADKLNISINTVITHRKNISQKTGIKSVSGLTIYAVLKKLVTLENLSE